MKIPLGNICDALVYIAETESWPEFNIQANASCVHSRSYEFSEKYWDAFSTGSSSQGNWPRIPSWNEIVEVSAYVQAKNQADRYLNGPDDFSTADGLDPRTKHTCLLYTSPSPRDS